MAANFSSVPLSSMALLRHPLSSPSHRPPEEDLESSWILEFVLCQPITDSFAHEIFLSLPFSSPDLHPHLRKIILLRRLSSDLSCRSISERTLHSLELIQELDRLQGARSSSRLKAAYCTAAIECTASVYRRGSGDFKDVVERIWKYRIFDLMRSQAAVGLVSEQLVEWLLRMGHYLLSGDGIEELLTKDVEDAMRLVKDYVEEALEEMDPSFLEITKMEFVEDRLSFEVDKTGKDSTEVNACSGKLDEDEMELENFGDGKNHGSLAGVSLGVLEKGEARDQPGVLADTSLKALEDNCAIKEATEVNISSEKLDEHVMEFENAGNGENQGDSVDVSMEVLEENEPRDRTEILVDTSLKTLVDDLAREKSVCLVDSLAKLSNDPQCVLGLSQHFVEVEFGGNKRSENDIEHDKTNRTECLIHKVDSVEVNKVKEALKKSCFDLNMVVEDPLPEAQVVATTISASISRDHELSSTLEDVRCNANRNTSNLKHLEGNHDGKEINKEAGPSKGIGIVARGTLFERNSTAHTCEWSDVSQESPAPADNLQSPNSTKRRIFCPRLNADKFVRKRVVKRWTSLEEDTLRKAVAKCGKGNWKLIMNSYPEIFVERNEVDLKDKWRNMIRHLS